MILPFIKYLQQQLNVDIVTSVFGFKNCDGVYINKSSESYTINSNKKSFNKFIYSFTSIIYELWVSRRSFFDYIILLKTFQSLKRKKFIILLKDLFLRQVVKNLLIITKIKINTKVEKVLYRIHPDNYIY